MVSVSKIPAAAGLTASSQTVRQAASGLYNIPPGRLVLPGLIIGNMAYKLGTEKDPQKRNDLLTNTLVSWAGGAALATMHLNKVLPYYLLPAIAGTIGLYQVAQKNTPQEKRDTAINHATWWFSGMAAQGAAKLMNLKGPFQSICAFAVGASVAGPLVSHFVKQKVVPLFTKNNLTPALNSFNTEYRIGDSTSPHFSPFAGTAPSRANQAAMSLNPGQQKASYDPLDPYSLNQLIPGGFLK
jgi:hypothetical protein